MIKKEERDIDKAKMKIRDLEWQRNKLNEMYNRRIDNYDSVLRTVTHLERELRSSNKIPNIDTEYYDLIEDRDRIRLLLEKSQSYRVSNANEIKKLCDNISRLQTDYDDVMGLYSRLLQECNNILTDKRSLEKKNKGLERDIEYNNIILEKEGHLKRKNKNRLIELELSGEVMKLLDEMAHRLPKAFLTRDEGYAACIEKLVITGCGAAVAKKE